MILRKPFAFFIKHFRLIHLIITISAVFLLFKTINILSFYLEYIDIMSVSSTTTSSIDLFGVMMIICGAVVIFGNFLIALLLKNKERPILFYIINIVIYIYLIVVYGFSYYITRKIEFGLVDIRMLRVLQDLLVIAIVFEVLSLIMFVIRTIGFDIKKFDFEREAHELEITQEDNEEVEVNVDFDFDKFKRMARKQFRHFKYVYVENKFIINLIMVILLIGIGYTSYLKFFVYDRIYKQGNLIDVAKYQLNISDAYVVTTDSRDNVIKKDVAFVVVNAKIRTTLKEETKFENARLSLRIGNHLFYSTRDYKDTFKDLGSIYLNENLKNTMRNYLFVFEIPESYKNKTMRIKYFDYNNKTANIKIKPNKFNNRKDYNYKLGDKIDFKDSILGNTTIEISKAAVGNSFKNNYEFCSKGTCYDSYEYIFPSYTGNTDKTVLKLTGTLNWDNYRRNYEINNLFSFIETYGSVTYVLNGDKKTMNMAIKEIKPSKEHDENICYIEIPKEAEKASEINIIFRIRDKVYKYVVK